MIKKFIGIFAFICISTFLLRQLENYNREEFRGDPEGVFYDSGAPNRQDPKDCSCTSGGAGEGGHMCGWNNSVSGDCRYKFAPKELMGKQRAFKYPHYYGYGTGNGFHYGEPYYTRTVDY